MADLPLVGAQAIISGMAAFSRDAAIVQNRLQAINRASGQLERETSSAFGGAGSAFSSMAGAITAASVVVAGAILGAGVASVKFAADYQTSLNKTQAFTQASDDQIKQLSRTIEDLARHGTNDMGDLADAATELARSGVPIESVLNGALQAVNDLTIASGGEIGLAASAKLVATSLSAFNLQASESTRITTAASVVAQNSAATFTGFGEAVAIAGASFQAAGFKLEDLAIAETILTKNGQSASVAATALRGFIQRLLRPSKDAAKVMEEYGIHLFDSAGKGVGFREVLGQLNKAFGENAISAGKLTEEERATALATLGLQRTSVALFNLAIAGTDAFDALNEKFKELQASALVEKMLEPLNAQLLVAKNNVVALAIAFGEQLLPPLQVVTAQVIAFLQNLSSDKVRLFGQDVAAAGVELGKAFVDKIQDLIAFAQQLATIPGVVDGVKGALILLGATIVANLVTPLLVAGAGFIAFLAVLATIALTIEAISTVVINAGIAIKAWAAQFGPVGIAISTFTDAIMNSFRAISAFLRGEFVAAGVYAGVAFGQFGATFKTVVGSALEGFGRLLDSTGAALQPWVADNQAAATTVGGALSGLHGIVQALQFLLQGNFPAAGEAASGAMRNFASAIEPIRAALTGTFKAAILWITDVGWPNLQRAAQEAGRIFNDDVKPKIEAIAKAIDNTVKTAFDWWTTQGWPKVEEAATAASKTINETVVPALEKIASTIDTQVKASLTWLTNEGLPNAGRAAQAAGAELLAFAAALGQANTAISNKGIYDDFAKSVKAVENGVRLLASAATHLYNSAVLLAQPFVQAASIFNGVFAAGLLGVQRGFKETASSGNLILNIMKFISEVLLGGARNFERLASAANGAASIIESVAGRIRTAADNLAAGLTAGLNRGQSQVSSAGAALGGAAVSGLNEGLGTHSPSIYGEEAGVDLGRGVVQGLAKIKLPVRNAAVSLADQALEAFRDIADKADQVMSDFNAKAINIGEDVGRKINEAIRDAARQIADAVQDTEDRILELGAGISQSRSDKGRRDSLKDDQDRRRDARKRAQEDAELVKDRAREDIDVAKKKNRDIADAQDQLRQDMSNADTDAERASSQARFEDKIEDINRRALLDQADLIARRATEDADRLETRKRQEDDAKFDADLAAESQRLDDQLEDEALVRSVIRLEKERDERVRTINEALTEKQKQIRDQGAREIKDLHEDTMRKIQILEDEFANKAVDILEKGGEAMRPLIDKIADALTQNFDGMRSSANSFTDSVNRSIDALNRLNDARRSADIGGDMDAPDVPAAGNNTPSFRGPMPPEFASGGFVPGQFGKPVQAIVHGGEFISGLQAEASRMMRALYQPMMGATAQSTYNYNVNANYADVQSPASVEMDMRALVLMSRG